MICPAPISNDQNKTQSQNRGNVTSYADITILTNQAPAGKILEVIYCKVFCKSFSTKYLL